MNFMTGAQQTPPLRNFKSFTRKHHDATASQRVLQGLQGGGWEEMQETRASPVPQAFFSHWHFSKQVDSVQGSWSLAKLKVKGSSVSDSRNWWLLL